jgi:hypothetical protein
VARRDATEQRGAGTAGAATLRPASLAGDADSGFRPRLLPPSSAAARGGRVGPAAVRGAARGGVLAAARPGDSGRRFLAWADALVSRWHSALGRLPRADFVFVARARAESQDAVHHTRVVVRSYERTRLLRPQLTLRLTLATSAPVERLRTTEVFERTLQALKDAPPAEASAAPVAQVFHVPLGRDAVEQRYRSAATPARPPSDRSVAPPHVRRERPEMVLRREGGRAETRPAPRRAAGDEDAAPFRAPSPHGRGDAAATQPPGVSWPDVGALTDQVMQRMQQRFVAQRERMGRI